MRRDGCWEPSRARRVAVEVAVWSGLLNVCEIMTLMIKRPRRQTLFLLFTPTMPSKRTHILQPNTVIASAMRRSKHDVGCFFGCGAPSAYRGAKRSITRYPRVPANTAFEYDHAHENWRQCDDGHNAYRHCSGAERLGTNPRIQEEVPPCFCTLTSFAFAAFVLCPSSTGCLLTTMAKESL